VIVVIKVSKGWRPRASECAGSIETPHAVHGVVESNDQINARHQERIAQALFIPWKYFFAT
jgi:hypothetical protein